MKKYTVFENIIKKDFHTKCNHGDDENDEFIAWV